MTTLREKILSPFPHKLLEAVQLVVRSCRVTLVGWLVGWLLLRLDG